MPIGAVSATTVGVGALFNTSAIFMVSYDKIEVVVGGDPPVWEFDFFWVVVRSQGNGILVASGVEVIAS